MDVVYHRRWIRVSCGLLVGLVCHSAGLSVMGLLVGEFLFTAFFSVCFTNSASFYLVAFSALAVESSVSLVSGGSVPVDSSLGG